MGLSSSVLDGDNIREEAARSIQTMERFEAKSFLLCRVSVATAVAVAAVAFSGTIVVAVVVVVCESE